MNFPFPTDDDIQALERLSRSAYAEDDMPFLRTQRYCLSPDFETSDVIAKQRVDMQGAMEMQYSLEQWRKGNV
jgi:hypothetical protein